MEKTWIKHIRQKMSAVLVCSLIASQLAAAAPAYGAGDRRQDSDAAEAETITLRGRIVSLAKGDDAEKDMELQLYVNGRPDTAHKPVLVRAEDTREVWDIYDDSIELIDDLTDDRKDKPGTATGSDETVAAGRYKVWEYRFENLPFEDKDGNEYEYTIRDLAYASATPSDAGQSGTASGSNLASGSNSAGSSHAARSSREDALFWTNMEGTQILGMGDMEFPAAGARLVYVPYTDVKGVYAFSDDAAAGGVEGAGAAAAVTLELGCVSEQDESFLTDDVEAELDMEKGIWYAEHLLQYNPLTCAAIDYRVKAVSGNEAYQIRYENRGRYAGQIRYGCDGGTIFCEKIVKEAVTYSVNGIITWNDWDNIRGKRPEQTDFLRVYKGERDVTGLVSVIWNHGAEEMEDSRLWSYTVSGLEADGNYTIRVEAMDGYAVSPSEVKAENAFGSNGKSALKNSAGPLMLEPFHLHAVKPADLTIENRYYGGSDQDEAFFHYILRTSADAGVPKEYTGEYVVKTDSDSDGETRNTSDGSITLKANEKAVITLDTGTNCSVEQMTDTDKEVLYDAEYMTEQTCVLTGDVTKTFINMKKQSLDYQKQWNDNGNKAGKRPVSAGTDNSYTNYLELKALKNGTYITEPEELKKLGLYNITPAISGEQANFWTIHYDHIPVTDEQGTVLVYELEEKPIPGYKLTSELTENAGIYEKILVNTSYTTLEADKIWRDNGNAYGTRDTVEKFAKRLRLGYTDGAEEKTAALQTTDPSGDNYLSIDPVTAEDDADRGDKWNIRIDNLLQFNDEGLPYAYYLTEYTENWKVDVEGMKPEDNLHYVPTYENPQNYINEKNRCYTGGIITNKLEGETNFTITKVWKDGKNTDRPTLTFQLMRYPGNLSVEEGYIHAAPVEVKTISGDDAIRVQGGKLVWRTGKEELLPRYNADGVEYVYFAKEILSGANSGDYVQRVTTMAGAASRLEELGLNLVADGEKLTNRLEKTRDIPVSKTWKSAAFQNIDAQVVLKVMRRSTEPGAAETEVTFDPELCISGFTPETITRTLTIPGMPVYDEEGYPYTYTVTEKEIRIRTSGTGDSYIPLVRDDRKQVYKTTKEHYPSEENPIQYKFGAEMETSADGEVLLTNILNDTMNVRVDKIWPEGWREKDGGNAYKYKKPETLTFTLYQDGVLYSGSLADGVVNPAVVSGDALNPYADGGIQKGICSFDSLPRYDGEGHEYVYTVTENVVGEVGIITYQYSWEYGRWEDNSQKDIDTRVVKVTNPPPGDGKAVWVQKQWLDDGDKLHRENVTVGLYQLVNDVWSDTGKRITLTEQNEWSAYFGIGAAANAGDYLVRETALSSHGSEARHPVQYGAGEAGTLKPPAEGMVSTEDHTYQVSHKKENDGMWTITNLRTGIVDVTVTKEWQDAVKETAGAAAGDVTDGKRPVSASFQLLQNGADYGNIKVTANNRSQQEDDQKPIIKWEDLPKYDENGKLYTYAVAETKMGDQPIEGDGSIRFTDAGGETHRYVSSITGGEYIHNKNEAVVDSGDTIPFHAVNKRQDTMDIVIYKVWKDDGEVIEGKRVRPDIHFILTRILKSDKDNPDAVAETVNAGKVIDVDASNEYEVKYLFDPVPRYHADGEEYLYYAEEGMDGNSNQYAPSYYPCIPSEIGVTAPSENRFELNHGTGTVVNRRNNTVHIFGEKIWKLMGGLENKDYPSVKLRLQSRVMYPEKPNMENPFEDVTSSAGGQGTSYYECTLGSDASVQKIYDYDFTGPEVDGHFPKFDENGKELQYYVKEVEINGEPVVENEPIYQRTSGDRSFVLENTYMDKGDCKVRVIKTWENVPAGDEGPAAVIKLHRVMVGSDGKNLEYTDAVKETKQLDYEARDSSAAAQTVEFTNLPRYAPNGRLYHYYVTEETIGGYGVTMGGTTVDSSGQFTFGSAQDAREIAITNTYQPKEPEQGAEVSIKGIKRWADNNNQYKIRPDDASNIDLTLHRKYKYRNTPAGIEYKEETVADTSIEWDTSSITPEGDTWSYQITLSNRDTFPKYAPNGTEYIYWVTEELKRDAQDGGNGNSGNSGNSGDRTLPERYTPGSGTEVTLAQAVSDPNALSITNTPVWTTLNITKTWEDQLNGYLTRPDSITLDIRRRVKTPDNSGAWISYATETIETDKTAASQTVSITYPAYERNTETNAIEGPYEYAAYETTVPGGYVNENFSNPANSTAVSPDNKTLTCSSSITNRLQIHTDTNVKLKARKVWDDNNNQDGFRSSKITVRLYRKEKGSSGDGEFVRKQEITTRNSVATESDITLDDWSVTWNALPRYMPGSQKEAEYYVTEQMDASAAKFYTSETASVSNADTGEVTWTFTNKHAPESVAVHVKKEWQDEENRWELRPAQIKVVLYSGEDPAGDPVVLSTDNNWEITFTGLPYAKNGVPIQYHVKEVGALQAYTLTGSPETISPDVKNGIHEGRITLTNKLRDTQLSVSKVWEQGNEDTRIVPSAVRIKLQRKNAADLGTGVWEDVADSTRELSKEDNWTTAYTHLPVCSNDGKEYAWRAIETGIKIDNEWLSEADFADSAKQLGGYMVEEAKPQKTTDGSYTQTITNTRCTGDIEVRKVWNHGQKPQSEYPEAVEVQLYKVTGAGMEPVGSPVTLSENVSQNQSWSHTWEKLAKYEKDGITPVVYRVREISLTADGTAVYPIPNGADPSRGTIGDYDYTTTVEKNGDKATVTILNRYSTRDIYAGKVWNDDGNRDGKRPSSITLELYQDGAATGKTVELDGIADTQGEPKPWTALWREAERRMPDGAEITYTVTEVNIPDDYSMQIQGSTVADPILVTNTHIPERTAYTVEKLWLDDEEWKEDVRPESIQLQLYRTDAAGKETAAGEPVTVREDPDTGRWSYTWKDLYKYQNEGREIRYYAREIGVDGYVSAASGSNALINRMNTTSLRVTKEWDDENNYYGIRPDRITIRLQRKTKDAKTWTTLPGTKAELTMESGNGWGAAEFTGLPTHDRQSRAYEYRAVEAAMDGQSLTDKMASGYEAVYEHQPNTLTEPGETRITNRLRTGALEVTKILKGGANTDFEFLVELTLDGKTEPYHRVITIRGGETFRIDRIPEGASYTVTERDKSGYRQVSKDGDTGVIHAGETAAAQFVNQKKPGGGGGGGGGTTPSKPDTTNPSGEPGGNPEQPDGPGTVEEPTQPETLETPAAEETGRLPEIPVTPERRPDIPTGTVVEIRKHNEPGNPPLYRGAYDESQRFDNLPEGRYELITLDDEGVPLGSLLIYIDDEGVPLALPRTGDTRIPAALLAAAMIGSMAGLVWIGRRKRKEEQK